MVPTAPSENVVDLSDAITVVHANLSGEAWGEQVRRQIDLDRLDDEAGARVVIHFPEWTMSMTTAFVRGLIRPSVVKLGAEGFWARYGFSGPDFLDVIEEEVIKAERFRLGAGASRAGS
jgi:hypothetical protein